MENKINIAELLKDCPQGMELDSPVYDELTFDYVNEEQARIYCKTENRDTVWFTIYGCVSHSPCAKCVIFPKDKTTWEGFVPPCKFKDGDIISDSLATCIFKGEGVIKGTVDYYCGVHGNFFNFKSKNNEHYGDIVDYRLATKEEKQKLFQAIKDNGYKWNAETKTLEKLSKFKTGDKLIHKDNKIHCTLGVYAEGLRGYRTSIGLTISDKELDEWELAPNKFDITTLKPFDKVLTRIKKGNVWGNDFFGYYKDGWFHCSGHIAVHQCIPYEGNEHLLDTTDDCEEFYKTWEE